VQRICQDGGPEEAQADPMQAFDINKNGKLELAEVKSAAAARLTS